MSPTRVTTLAGLGGTCFFCLFVFFLFFFLVYTLFSCARLYVIAYIPVNLLYNAILKRGDILFHLDKNFS